MISVKEAKHLISEHIKALNPISIDLAKASGHILAADVHAQYDIPAFSQSAMDGYALKFDDREKALHLIGEMAAGTATSITIQNGETSRIFTGAPLPKGADTVVMQEKITKADGKITLQDPNLKPGLNVRDKGSEIMAGALAMEKGDFLSPAAIGFLAGIGISEVSVYPMPKIAIIVTGKELQQPGKPLEFGQVYESNSYSLSAALNHEGIEQVAIYGADDDLGILKNVLQTAMVSSDVVLLTGGVSVGDYDFVIEAASHCGIKQIFHKVKQKPGKPLFFGTKDQKLIFGLPGNPSSVLSCYYNYVLPAIKTLSHKNNSVMEAQARLTHSYSKPSGLTHFLKGKYENGLVTPLSAQESYRLSSFAQANCLICLDETQEHFNKNDLLTVMILPN
ncbi:molybdopterin molybdotransferase MoeA [Pedobacter zeae]|uniref:Molybdopterin molybdenumtransferase n=1 Tax=Pedobacter zeae TaxID=1737356 RepID=A0A7W6P3F1_9SPHI|nr:gephyrin-like molybdotransferase Glp [Pedobacter zeae]MBB4106414.1 molybdopterin molybdotransferase [Pedobacter zeae]GGH01543.1 molybdopterin molybdenumtransferase MoeA [Pedobacter zeae]